MRSERRTRQPTELAVLGDHVNRAPAEVLPRAGAETCHRLRVVGGQPHEVVGPVEQRDLAGPGRRSHEQGVGVARRHVSQDQAVTGPGGADHGVDMLGLDEAAGLFDDRGELATLDTAGTSLTP